MNGEVGAASVPRGLSGWNWNVCALAVSGMPLAGDLVVNAGRGPVTVHIPSSYDDSRFFPLVLSLHGYSYNGAGLEAYFQLLPLAEQ